MAMQPLQIQGQALQTPAMVPLQRRSQYLADALEAIQRSTSEGIRSPMQLGSNLLANAILMHGMRGNDRRMLEEAGRARESVADIILGGLNGGQSDTPAPMQTQAMAPQAPPTMNQPQQPSSFLEARPPSSSGMYYVDEYPPGGPPEPGMQQPPQQMQQQPAMPQQQPAMPQQQPAAPQQQPAMPQAPAPYAGVPRGVVTPEERGMVEQLLRSGNPALFEQGMTMGQSLMQRQMAPVPLSPGHTYNQDGSVRDLEENWQQIPGATPADQAQRNTVTGRVDHQAIPGVQGPNGTFLTQQGYELPPSFVNGQQLPFGVPSPDQVRQASLELMNSQPVSQYYNLRTKAAAIFNDMQNGAVNDLRLIETLQESLNGNPQLAVREGLIHNITESQGFVAGLLGQAQNAASMGRSGYLQPEIRGQILRVIEDAVNERYEAAHSYVERARVAMQPLGYPDQFFPTIDEPVRRGGSPGHGGQQGAAQQPARVPAGMSPQQAMQWARQQGLRSGDPIILPDGRQARVP